MFDNLVFFESPEKKEAGFDLFFAESYAESFNVLTLKFSYNARMGALNLSIVFGEDEQREVFLARCFTCADYILNDLNGNISLSGEIVDQFIDSAYHDFSYNRTVSGEFLWWKSILKEVVYKKSSEGFFNGEEQRNFYQI